MSKIEALAKYLNIPIPSDEYAFIDEDSNETEQDFSEYESIEEIYKDQFKVNGSTYMVLTEHEADQCADEYLDEKIAELVSAMNQVMNKRLAQTLESYFDYDCWKHSVLLSDGRGFLASYDGSENEILYNGDLYLVYRMD